MFAVREDLVLQRQERAIRIDEIDARQSIGFSDFLGAKMLFHRHRVVGSALHGSVVGEDHALLARHPADTGDYACGWDIATVHAMGGEL
jgi:hypothetical protein